MKNQVNNKDNIEMQLEISNKCYLRCKHCSSMMTTKNIEPGYSIEDINNLICKINKPTDICLTGGEPLGVLNLSNIINKLSVIDSCKTVSIFTSGIIKEGLMYSGVSSKAATELMNAGLTSVNLSIYHTVNDYHDLITDLPDSFSYVTDTIAKFIKVGVNIKAHLIINKYNYKTLNCIINNLTDMGVSEVRLLRLVKTGNAIKHWHEIGLPYNEQLDVVVNIINNINKYGIKITLSGYPDIYKCRPYDEAIKCQAGSNLLYINYSGYVYPCGCTMNNADYILGHVSNIDIISKHIQTNNGYYHPKCLNTV